MPALSLRALEGQFSVCRVPAGSALPTPANGAALWSATVTGDEVSVVCADDSAPDGAAVEPGWRALAVSGPLAFELTGVLASLATPLADAGVPIFALSTYDTDYILVPAERLEVAAVALRDAGHEVID